MWILESKDSKTTPTPCGCAPDSSPMLPPLLWASVSRDEAAVGNRPAAPGWMRAAARAAPALALRLKRLTRCLAFEKRKQMGGRSDRQR